MSYSCENDTIIDMLTHVHFTLQGEISRNIDMVLALYGPENALDEGLHP